ncbi:MAG: TolC family protein [Labilithrix sp.]|nr:TolC family protein [Labilithrix sp.]MCW5816251.1 TolC family protein [Labilithrix sp.]
MKPRALTLAIVLLSGSAAAEEAAPEAAPPIATQAIDERKVTEMALRSHPTIGAAVAAREAAEAAASAADWARVPELRLNARYARLSSIPAQYRTFDGFTFPQLLNQVAGRASVVVPLTDAFMSLAATARSAGHTAEAAAIDVVTARAQIAYEARAAFLDYWSRTLAVRNATELVKAAENNAVDQRNREKAGTVAHNDVLAFETALDAAVMGLELAKGELAGAEASLRTYVPELRDKQLVVPDISFDDDALASTRVPVAPAVPPRLASLSEQTRAAAERADAVAWQRLPSLSVYASGDMAAPNPRVFVATRLVFVPSWDVGVQLEWSLSQATAGGARASQARQEQAAFEARLADARRRLDGERQGAVGILTAATARARRARDRVERAVALAKARRVESETGTALPLNVVLAETDLARARNEYVEAFVMRALALAKIDFIDGRAAP